jgi:hypothetical protein
VIRANSDKWFSARVPQKEDGCFLEAHGGAEEDVLTVERKDDVVCWWHMKDGRVLGVHDGQV